MARDTSSPIGLGEMRNSLCECASTTTMQSRPWLDVKENAYDRKRKENSYTWTKIDVETHMAYLTGKTFITDGNDCLLMTIGCRGNKRNCL